MIFQTLFYDHEFIYTSFNEIRCDGNHLKFSYSYKMIDRKGGRCLLENFIFVGFRRGNLLINTIKLILFEKNHADSSEKISFILLLSLFLITQARICLRMAVSRH